MNQQAIDILESNADIMHNAGNEKPLTELLQKIK